MINATVFYSWTAISFSQQTKKKSSSKYNGRTTINYLSMCSSTKETVSQESLFQGVMLK